MAITKKIDPIPTAPSRSDPENFDERADAFLKRIETLDEDLNEWASQANSTAGEVNSMRNATYSYMLQAKNAQSYCIKAAANANYRGVWSSSASYSVGDAVAYNGYVWISNYDNNVGHTPGTDNYWTWLNPLLNNSGQLTLPFSQTPILVNGQDLMHRTFYVDAVNGDDSNPGTGDAPFKTLKKAIDSVPVGGKATVSCTSDVTLSEEISLHSKNIRIVLNDHTLVVSSFSDTVNKYFGFEMSGSEIRIESGTIQLSGKANTDLSWAISAIGAVFKGSHPAGPNLVSIGSCSLLLPADAGVLCCTGISAWSILTHLLLERCVITRDGGVIYAVQGSGSGIGTLSIFDTTITDSSGNAVEWTDVVSGIIYDSSNIPRNIVSNIIF